jgi:hypothetical protein
MTRLHLHDLALSLANTRRMVTANIAEGANLQKQCQLKQMLW